MQIMVTNGGPHPADKWAEVTTEAILNLVQIGEDSISPEAAEARQAKRNLRGALFAIFNAHHEGVQKHERGQLAKAKTSKVGEALDPSHHMPSVTKSVEAALAATPFAEHFAKPEVLGVVHTIIGQHTADSMHIERKWHEDALSAPKGA
jgi:hypothetical protein